MCVTFFKILIINFEDMTNKSPMVLMVPRYILKENNKCYLIQTKSQGRRHIYRLNGYVCDTKFVVTLTFWKSGIFFLNLMIYYHSYLNYTIF